MRVLHLFQNTVIPCAPLEVGSAIVVTTDIDIPSGFFKKLVITMRIHRGSVIVI